MYNKNKDLLKLALLIILVLSIPLVFITLEAIQSMHIVQSQNPVEEINNSLETLYNNVLAKKQNNDSAKIRTAVLEIFKLFNSKDFDKLYSLVTPDMKELFFPTQEEFETYMQTYLKTEKYSPNFSTYEKLNNTENDIFIITIQFFKYTTDEDDILTDKTPLITDTFTLYFEDDTNYKFSFNSFIGTSSPNTTFSNDALEIKLLKTNLYKTQTAFKIEITNKTNTDIVIDENGIYCYVGLMTNSYPSSVIIPANSSKTVQYTIYTGFNLKTSLPKYLYFKGVRSNGMVYLFSISIDYPISISL